MYDMEFLWLKSMINFDTASLLYDRLIKNATLEDDQLQEYFMLMTMVVVCLLEFLAELWSLV